MDETIDLTKLIKAQQIFEKFRQGMEDDRDKAGAIQAFEFCYELSWKMMKRLLEVRGKIGNSPREVFRMAGLEGFIKDPEIWFNFLQKRNITVHTYEEKEAQEVISVFSDFSNEITNFLNNIGA